MKHQLLTTALLAAVWLLTSEAGQAQIIVADYTFATDLTSSDADSGSTAAAFAGNKSYYVRSGSAQNFLMRNTDGVTNVGTYATSRFNAFTSNFTYASFTITPTSELDFTQLAFNYGGGAAGGRSFTANFAITTNQGGHTEAARFGETSLLVNADVTTTPNNFTFDLSTLSALQNVNTATTFRIYYWVTGYSSTPGATAFDGMRLDNIQVTAVPEPSTLAMGLGGLVALVVLRRFASTKRD